MTTVLQLQTKRKQSMRSSNRPKQGFITQNIQVLTPESKEKQRFCSLSPPTPNRNIFPMLADVTTSLQQHKGFFTHAWYSEHTFLTTTLFLNTDAFCGLSARCVCA